MRRTRRFCYCLSSMPRVLYDSQLKEAWLRVDVERYTAISERNIFGSSPAAAGCDIQTTLRALDDIGRFYSYESAPATYTNVRRDAAADLSKIFDKTLIGVQRNGNGQQVPRPRQWA